MKKTPLRKVSTKQAKRNRELAKIPPPTNGMCQECGKPPDWRGLQKHHKLFRSRGGKDNPGNLIFVCGRCHAEFHGIKESNDRK